MSSELPTINISSQPIELCKLLKVANMVSGGGEAKIVISEGYVALNGEVEFQKRKKVYDQDVVEFNGDIVQIVVSKNKTDPSVKKTKSTSSDNKKSKNKTAKTHNEKTSGVDNVIENTATKSKRRPISF